MEPTEPVDARAASGMRKQTCPISEKLSAMLLFKGRCGMPNELEALLQSAINPGPEHVMPRRASLVC